MILWLLRHGEAQPHARSDAQRALTEQGRAEVRQSAERLRGRSLQRILVSPYLRAQQTAELVRDTLGLDLPLTTLDWLTPDDSPREVANRLDQYPADELLVVSHNPLLGALAGLLVHGHLQLPFPLRTASLVGLEAELLMPGLMHQIELHHPR